MIDISLLIDEVQKRPALWDQAHPHRHNREVLEVLWEEVAKVFAAPPDDLRKKWKGLRDTFRKELRKYPNGFDQDLSQEEFPPWVFFKPLYFLKGQMKAKRSDVQAANGYHYLMGVHKEEDDNSAEEVLAHHEMEPAGVCSTLRDLGARGVKRSAIDEVFVDDEDYHFFLSLLPHVRRLEPVRKLQMRARIQDLVCREVYGAQPEGQAGPHRDHRDAPEPITVAVAWPPQMGATDSTLSLSVP
ncbi:uncharacterized protein LOC117639666 [Thrips palmi]|uniref:Uncharacterized protein LOC117639666 n=1 Tax=Thrips palmi TaxID=161013 RepID=A0A6P8Y4R2_THRPL|nr:uncharacterized protein LOC117639666 [Thrips palmi]